MRVKQLTMNQIILADENVAMFFSYILEDLQMSEYEIIKKA